jgi:two-component system LytT family response regulator
MITALLVDDEPLASEYLARLLADYPWIKVIGTAETLQEAQKFLENQTPHILFLDMELKRNSGLNLLRFVEPDTHVVFVTAHEHYAVAAFTAGALDYLLKPVLQPRLEVALNRLSKQSGKLLRDLDPSSKDTNTTKNRILSIVSKKEKKVDFIVTKEIAWIESMQNYTTLQLRGREQPVIFRRKISDWADELEEIQFPRLGRSIIVHLDLVRKLQWSEREETLVTFADVARPLVLSRALAERLKKILPAKTVSAG